MKLTFSSEITIASRIICELYSFYKRGLAFKDEVFSRPSDKQMMRLVISLSASPLS